MGKQDQATDAAKVTKALKNESFYFFVGAGDQTQGNTGRGDTSRQGEME